MIRWIFVCLLLSVCAVAAVWAVAPPITPPPQPEPTPKPDPEPPQLQPEPEPPQPAKEPRQSASGRPAQPVLIEFAKQNREMLTETIIIPNAPVVIASIQEVASEKEGILTFIGTDVQPGEVVPPEKQLPRAELGFLAVPVGMNENVPAEEKFKLYGDQEYRRLRDDDELAPHKIALAREFRPVRKLQVGDHVKAKQLLALVSPKKAFDDVTMKVAKLDAADFDKKASEKKRDEYDRRYRSQLRQNQTVPGSVPKDELEATRLQRD
ncbi:MAG TPA: hypothetical protein VKE94_01535, partial [Gemmataceae bacterium]|nr:hypothetical protein [Gemmataceae bacterium]